MVAEFLCRYCRRKEGGVTRKTQSGPLEKQEKGGGHIAGGGNQGQGGNCGFSNSQIVGKGKESVWSKERFRLTKGGGERREGRRRSFWQLSDV